MLSAALIIGVYIVFEADIVDGISGFSWIRNGHTF